MRIFSPRFAFAAAVLSAAVLLSPAARADELYGSVERTAAPGERALVKLRSDVAGPVLLVLYLLNLTDPPAGRMIGFDLTRPRFDLGFGALIALAIGIPGLGLYALARIIGINTDVQASGLGDN